MTNVLVLGAGKSATVLIDYLTQNAAALNMHITVADVNKAAAEAKTKNRPHTTAISLDTADVGLRQEVVAHADIVISMLPAFMHPAIAADCLQLRKHLVTPSYVSPAIQQMDKDAAQKGLVFMNELGLDPGIDHMSAVELIARLRNEGNTITGFRSHCGGLVAPACDTNPWHYKFSWNPRNVILAGQGEGGIHYLENGEEKHLRYEQLFASATPLAVEGYGMFESYPNRDSLRYLEAYGLQGVKTMYRGTLRVPPFCRGWQLLVDAGFTRDVSTDTEPFRYSANRVLAANNHDEVTALLQSIHLSEALAQYTQPTINPAIFLQQLLEKHWAMQPGDRDLVVMVHEIEYTTAKKEKRKVQASLVVEGKDDLHTAMAETVGLPMAIFTAMLVKKEVKETGVLLPLSPHVYNPILAELKKHHIQFTEKTT